MRGPVGPGTTTRWPSSLVAVLLGWVVAGSWRPLVERPERFWWPVLVAGAAVSAIGVGLRTRRLPTGVIVPAQLLGGLAVLLVWFADGWWRLATSVPGLISSAASGAEAINRLRSPVPAHFEGTAPFLAALGVLLVVVVEAGAATLRRPALVALPALLGLTVPTLILAQRLDLLLVMSAALLWWALLWLEEQQRLRAWGRAASGGAAGDARTGLAPLAVAAGTIAGALVLSTVTPVSSSSILARHRGHGTAKGPGGVALANPLVGIRRDLLTRTHTPMVHTSTDDPDPSYLRLTVLDELDGATWRPSARSLPASNRVHGPVPTGLIPGSARGPSYRWRLRLDDGFDTTWLPLPGPTSSVRVPGDWRYDSRTLDVVDVDRGRPTGGLRYAATAVRPQYSPAGLAAAPQAPGEVGGPLVDLPATLPPVVRDVTARVTRGARTPYAQLVRLQSWFRSRFRYSLAQRPGSGLEGLARFLTTDRVGYCQQFATAMAVMGRTLQIPSRVVVGYLHPSRVRGRQATWTSDDLHAWPEFYFSGQGWVRFEPTPAVRTGTRPPEWTAGHRSPQARTPTASARPQPRGSLPLPGPRRPDAVGASSTHRDEGAPWWAIPAAAVLLIAAAAGVPTLVRRRQRRRRLDPSLSDRELVEGAWAELRATATDYGIGWPEDRSPRETLGRVQARVSSDVELRGLLATFTELVERARYAADPRLTGAEREEVGRIVAAWSAAMAGAASERVRSRARWLPRSVYDARTPAPAEHDPELLTTV